MYNTQIRILQIPPSQAKIVGFGEGPIHEVLDVRTEKTLAYLSSKGGEPLIYFPRMLTYRDAERVMAECRASINQVGP